LISGIRQNCNDAPKNYTVLILNKSKMKNIILIIAFALFVGTYSASAQETASVKKESCCASKKSCSSAEKAKCVADATCTAAEKAKCMANGKAKKPAGKGKV
jgi:hypothetical protein